MNPSRQSSDSISRTREVFQPWRAIRKSCAVSWASGFLLLVLGAGQTAHGFTAADRALAWQCYKNTFYFTYTDSKGTRAYFRDKEGDPNAPASSTSFWQSAEQIEMACDAADVAAVNLLCNGFVIHNGTDWSGNTFNDDLCWAAIAHCRAYALTGNTTYRTLAKNAFDVAWNRGWDTAGGGGMWQNTADAAGPGKLSCANGPACIAAYKLYTSLGDSTYLTKAQTIHTWQTANSVNASGGVQEGPNSPTTFYTYDQGTYVGGAWLLGDTAQITPTGNFTQSRWGVNMQHFGTGADAGGFNGICLRWFAIVGYNTAFLQSVCNNAWGLRNSAGLMGVGWYAGRTSDTAILYSWDCSNGVVGMLLVPPG